MMTKLKALLLIPAAFAGMFTVLVCDTSSPDTTGVLVGLGIFAILILSLATLLGWLWRRPGERRYLGHSGRTWATMLGVAYVAGLVAALLM
jgi:hypothetical protein